MRAPILERPGERTETGEAATIASRTARWPEHGLLVVQVATLLLITATVATKTWQDHIWVGFIVTAATAACWLPELRRPRARRWWFAYVAGIFVYTLLRSYADETTIPVRTMYVIDADRMLFLGIEPVVWLQERLFSPTRVSLLDILAVQVHWSFFIAPHAAAIAIYFWRREFFPRYAVLVVSTMYVGLLLFFLVPTTPPWLAAQAGALPEAFRIMDFVGGRVDSETYRAFYESLGEPNSVAAMPSIHMGVTFAMYLWARDHYPRLGPWLLLYSAVMAFSLIYLAEHYPIDLLAGVAVALVCHVGSKRLVAAPAPD